MGRQPNSGRGVVPGSRKSIVRAPFGPAGSWNLDFWDDFDGPANSAPNLTRWDYWNVDTDRGSATGRPPAWCRRENTYLSGNSELILRATTADIGYGAQQSIGGLETAYYMGPEEFLECEMTFDGVIWAAFWSQTDGGMQGVNATTSTSGDASDGAEYDIGETFSTSLLQQNVHWGGYIDPGSGGNHRTTGHNATTDGTTLYNPGDWIKLGFHRSVRGGFCNFYTTNVTAGTPTRLDYTFPYVISTRTDHGMRLTCEAAGTTNLAFAKVRYAARWTGG